MISFQKRFLFVHIPKTAGNSIQSVLRDYSEDELVALRGEQDGIERFGLRNPKYKIKKHSTLAEYGRPLAKRSLGTSTSSPVYEIRGTEWSHIILLLRKKRRPGIGRNSERSFQALCRSQIISGWIRAKKIRSVTSIT